MIGDSRGCEGGADKGGAEDGFFAEAADGAFLGPSNSAGTYANGEDGAEGDYDRGGDEHER